MRCMRARSFAVNRAAAAHPAAHNVHHLTSMSMDPFMFQNLLTTQCAFSLVDSPRSQPAALSSSPDRLGGSRLPGAQHGTVSIVPVNGDVRRAHYATPAATLTPSSVGRCRCRNVHSIQAPTHKQACSCHAAAPSAPGRQRWRGGQHNVPMRQSAGRLKTQLPAAPRATSRHLPQHTMRAPPAPAVGAHSCGWLGCWRQALCSKGGPRRPLRLLPQPRRRMQATRWASARGLGLGLGLLHPIVC